MNDDVTHEKAIIHEKHERHKKSKSIIRNPSHAPWTPNDEQFRHLVNTGTPFQMAQV